jgi:AmiR/NasT family two-component response regulator
MKPKQAAPMHRYTVELPEGMYQKLRKEAFKKQETVAEITRRVIEVGLAVL